MCGGRLLSIILKLDIEKEDSSCVDDFCGFSDPKLKHKKMERYIFMRRVCAVKARNLAEVKTKKEAGTRETTTDLKSLLFNFAW